jgi:hypothetical protein
MFVAITLSLSFKMAILQNLTVTNNDAFFQYFRSFLQIKLYFKILIFVAGLIYSRFEVNQDEFVHRCRRASGFPKGTQMNTDNMFLLLRYTG